jgi:hypothetical protein
MTVIGVVKDPDARTLVITARFEAPIGAADQRAQTTHETDHGSGSHDQPQSRRTT